MPFVYVPDLIDTLVALGDAESASLKEPENGYAVPAFSFSARELFDEIKKHYPDFTWEVELDANMDKFSRLWPNSMSAAEVARDLHVVPKYRLPETVQKKILDFCSNNSHNSD
jgi:nucleoside-diphosphate-sugar epimerase